MRVEKEHGHIPFLIRLRSEVILHCSHGDVEELIFLRGGSVLLGNVQISELGHGLLCPDNMDLSFIPHLSSESVPLTEGASLPFFFKPETASAKTVPEHLLASKSLPEVSGHSILPDRRVKAVSFSPDAIGNRIEGPFRILSEKDH